MMVPQQRHTRTWTDLHKKSEMEQGHFKDTDLQKKKQNRTGSFQGHRSAEEKQDGTGSFQGHGSTDEEQDGTRSNVCLNQAVIGYDFRLPVVLSYQFFRCWWQRTVLSYLRLIFSQCNTTSHGWSVSHPKCHLHELVTKPKCMWRQCNLQSGSKNNWQKLQFKKKNLLSK